MGNVKSLNGKYTPLEIAQRVPWERIKNCIVIYEDDEDNCSVLNISQMSWKDRVWLTGELVGWNAAETAIEYIEARSR